MAVRLTIVVDETTYRALKDLASSTGRTEGEVIRDAIALAKTLSDERRSGSRVILEGRGRSREIVFSS